MDASSSTTSAVYRGLLWEEGGMRQTDVPGDTQTHCGTRGHSERDRRTRGGTQGRVGVGHTFRCPAWTHRTHSVASSLPVSRLSLTAASSQRWQKR